MMMWRSLKAGDILSALAKSPKAETAKSTPVESVSGKPAPAPQAKAAN